MRTLRLIGVPEKLGERYGALLAPEIHALYERRTENALRQARTYGSVGVDEASLLGLARDCCAHTQAFDPEGFAELEGIAAGAGLEVERVLAMNGLTDLRDALAWNGSSPEGCTAVVVPGPASRDGEVVCGQTWDLATDNQPYVVAVERLPESAPRTWSVTTAGCLSLIGINEAGLAVGTTNLRTRDARAGVPYLSLIHAALRCTDAVEAAERIEGARRAGAHFYYLCDARGTAIALECSAKRSRRLSLATRPFVQTNHCAVPAHQGIEADTPQRSSRARARRMEALLAGAEFLDVATLERFLADADGGELAICRHDFDGISTNAAAVLEPAARRIHACAGPPGRNPWVTLEHDFE